MIHCGVMRHGQKNQAEPYRITRTDGAGQSAEPSVDEGLPALHEVSAEITYYD